MVAKKSPIAITPSKQGSLRKATGTKQGQTIPVAKLKTLANSKNPITAKRAQFALNARQWAKKK